MINRRKSITHISTPSHPQGSKVRLAISQREISSDARRSDIKKGNRCSRSLTAEIKIYQAALGNEI